MDTRKLGPRPHLHVLYHPQLIATIRGWKEVRKLLLGPNTLDEHLALLYTIGVLTGCQTPMRNLRYLCLPIILALEIFVLV